MAYAHANFEPKHQGEYLDILRRCTETEERRLALDEEKELRLRAKAGFDEDMAEFKKAREQRLAMQTELRSLQPRKNGSAYRSNSKWNAPRSLRSESNGCASAGTGFPGIFRRTRFGQLPPTIIERTSRTYAFSRAGYVDSVRRPCRTMTARSTWTTSHLCVTTVRSLSRTSRRSTQPVTWRRARD